jgi:hypothetical protein
MFGQPPKQNKQPQPAGPQNSGPAPLSAKYDTATQTFRKPSVAPPKGAKAGGGGAGGSKGGFAGKSSMVRPLSPQEHMQAADHLAAGGFHHAAAHHRSAGEAMSGKDSDGDNDGD